MYFYYGLKKLYGLENLGFEKIGLPSPIFQVMTFNLTMTRKDLINTVKMEILFGDGHQHCPFFFRTNRDGAVTISAKNCYLHCFLIFSFIWLLCKDEESVVIGVVVVVEVAVEVDVVVVVNDSLKQDKLKIKTHIIFFYFYFKSLIQLP